MDWKKGERALERFENVLPVKPLYFGLFGPGNDPHLNPTLTHYSHINEWNYYNGWGHT